MTLAFPDGRRVFLSTLPAGRRERRLALAVVLVSLGVFLTAVPFAKVPLGQSWTFIPIYQSALVINDLITAILLFGQLNFVRSRALAVLACGYLFTAFMAVAHALTFPGLFAPTGLLGAGPQSTAWLYMFWHGGFPFLVIAYALLKSRESRETIGPGGPGVAVLVGVLIVVLVLIRQPLVLGVVGAAVVDLRMRAPDVAGTLHGITGAVAAARANIVSIEHDRAFSGLELGQTRVELVIETNGTGHIAAVEAELTKAGFEQRRA